MVFLCLIKFNAFCLTKPTCVARSLRSARLTTKCSTATPTHPQLTNCWVSCAAVALLTDTVKLDGTLSIEVRGQGVLALLMAESNPGGELRAIARIAEDAALPSEHASFRELVGDGQIVITLDPKEGHRYQGIVGLDHDTLGGCLEAYFGQSEQLPTRLWLAADGERAGGLLLQRLPDASQNQDVDAWERSVHLADTIKQEELLGLEQREVLYRLYHEETVRVFDPKALRFDAPARGSACVMRSTPLARMNFGIFARTGAIDTQCHFCHTKYHYTAADIEILLEDPGAPPPVIH